MKSILSLLAITLLGVPPALGENSARTARVRSLTFQIQKPMPELFAHSVAIASESEPQGQATKPLNYLNHESESIRMHGDQLVFTTDADRKSMNDPAKVMARVKLADSLDSAILLWVPSGAEPGSPPFRILPIDDSTKAFPRGSLKVVNLSSKPFRLMLEKQKFDLRAGSIQTIEDPPTGERNASAMHAFTLEGDKWQRVGAGLWPHPGTKRVLQIAYLDPSSKQLQIRGIRDISVREAESPDVVSGP